MNTESDTADTADTAVSVYCIDEGTPASEGWEALHLITPSNSKSPGGTLHRAMGGAPLGRTEREEESGHEMEIEYSRSYYTGQGARRRSVRIEGALDVVVDDGAITIIEHRCGQDWQYAVRGVRPVTDSEGDPPAAPEIVNGMRVYSW